MIDYVPPVERKDVAEEREDYLKQNTDIEVVEPGFRSIINIDDIVPLTNPTESDTSSVSQLPLQFIKTNEGSFVVVAAKSADGTALLVNRVGDGTRRAVMAGSVSDGCVLDIYGYSGDSVAPILFSVHVTEESDIVIENPTLNTTIDLYTKLKPMAEKNNRAISVRTAVRRAKIERERPSEFAKHAENPFVDHRMWSVKSAKVEQHISDQGQ